MQKSGMSMSVNNKLHSNIHTVDMFIICQKIAYIFSVKFVLVWNYCTSTQGYKNKQPQTFPVCKAIIMNHFEYHSRWH